MDLNGEGGCTMPMDPTNPSEQRNAPFREGDDQNQGHGPDARLKIENMLLEEYNYAATAAYQAMEDRARSDGRELKSLSLDEWVALWDEAKSVE